MKRAGELRQKAERYRRVNRQISDPVAERAICDLAAEFEMTAAELEKRHHAHEIWMEQGRPTGRDMENWLAAEREVVGEDRHLRRGRRRA
jgi:predicted patatin/cPLA2 family phospholipase